MDLGAFLSGSVRDLFGGKDLGMVCFDNGTIRYQMNKEEQPSLEKLYRGAVSELSRIKTTKARIEAVRQRVVGLIKESLEAKDVPFLLKKDVEGLIGAVQKVKLRPL